MKVGKNCIVSVSYRLTNDRGELLAESPGEEPLAYLHGASGVLPALENALQGKAVGDGFDVAVTPADGFGEHRPDLMQVAPRSAFPPDQPLEIGLQIAVQTETENQTAIITAMDEHTVSFDANHPLAGMNLRFIGTVEAVREATPEEVRHWPDPPPGG